MASLPVFDEAAYPPKHGLGVELEHFAGLVQIALMRAVILIFYDLQFRLSRVALSLCLARMLVVEGTLLERSEWIWSFCHLGSPTDRCRMEKRGELRNHSLHVRF